MRIERPAIDLAAWNALASPCRLCELRCGVDRGAGELGRCGVGPRARYYNAFVHLGEEPELIPCFTLFLTGCNFRCPYCSDAEWVDDPGRGRILEAEELVARIRSKPHLRSVEFVGGLGDVNLPHLAEVARGIPPDLPIVLNTNGWLTPEALELLPAMVDLLLLDVKHGSDRCAAELAAPAQQEGNESRGLHSERQQPVGELARFPRTDYLPTLERTFQLARAGLRLGVWIRHLLLPGHFECCTLPVLNWLARLAPGTYTNLLTQYRPLHRILREPTRWPTLGRTWTAQERQALPERLRRLELPLDLRLDGRPLNT